MIFGLDALLINQTLDVNIVALGKWRAYRQVLRQSVGWFESDFAGRISSRVMEAPKAAAQVVLTVFEGLLFMRWPTQLGCLSCCCSPTQGWQYP